MVDLVRRNLAASLLVSALSVPAWAGDARLEIGLGADMNYEDNVFSAAHDETGDFYLTVGPRLNAYDRRGALQWNLNYNPNYLKYHRFDELDDWEHFASGEVSWVPTDRTRVFGSAHYVDASSFQRLTQVDPVLGDVGVELTTQGVERLTLEAGVSHRVTQRNTATFRVQRLENDYELLTQQDVEVLEGSLEWLYDLGPRDRTGLEFRYSRQEFGVPNADTNLTEYYNVSAIWQHAFDPTMYFNISVGPAFVEPEDQSDVEITIPRFPRIPGINGVFGPVVTSTCPTLDDGTPILSPFCASFPLPVPDELTTIGVIGDLPEDDSALTYFAAATFVKQWKRVRGELLYSRDTSTSSDVGGNSVRDFVLGRLDWHVTSRFRTDLELAYQRFESATDNLTFVTALNPASPLGEVVGLRGILFEDLRENEIYWARLRFRYDLTPRTLCTLSVIWQTQISELPPELKIKTDRLVVVLGFTYRFRPISLGI